MQDPLLPPYTPDSLARRFPSDQKAAQLIIALVEWKIHRRQRADILKTHNLTQATLYRIYQRWKEGGVQTLLSQPNGHSRIEITRELIRRWLKLLPILTSFQFGNRPEVSSLLQRFADPAIRGHIMVTMLNSLVENADEYCYKHYGIHGVVSNYTLGQPINLTKGNSISERTKRRAIAKAIDCMKPHITLELRHAKALPIGSEHQNTILHGREQIQAQINTALKTNTTVQLLGLSGMGKSSLAARIAMQWQRAGWSVCWITCQPTEYGESNDLLYSLHSELGRIGALSTPVPDQSWSTEDHVHVLNQALHSQPTLLIIDNIQHWHLGINLAQILFRETNETNPTLKVLACGQSAPFLSDSRFCLDGLDETTSRQFYEQQHGKVCNSIWEQVNVQTRGNPMLLLNTWPQHTTPSTNTIVAPHPIDNILNHLSRSARGLLFWLIWWRKPLLQTHPYARAAPGGHFAWDALTRAGLIQITNDSIAIHDLVRQRVTLLGTSDEWLSIRSSVQEYAELHNYWNLFYYCAADATDYTAMIKAAQTWAERAEALDDLPKAAHWWQIAAQAGQLAGEKLYTEQCLMAACAHYLRLHHIRMANIVLSGFSESTDPVIQWHHTFYRARIALQQGQYNTHTVLLASTDALLNELCLTETDHWEYHAYKIKVACTHGQIAEASEAYAQLGPPPNNFAALYDSWYILGATIAMYQGNHTKSKAYWLQLRQQYRSQSQRYSALHAEVLWACSLYDQERLQLALRQLNRLERSIPEEWHPLHLHIAIYQLLSVFEMGYYNRISSSLAKATQLNTIVKNNSYSYFLELVATLYQHNSGTYCDERLAQLEAVYRDLKIPTQQAHIMAERSRYLLAVHSVPKAKALLIQFLLHIRQFKLKEWSRLRHEYLAIYYAHIGKWDKALRCYDRLWKHFNTRSLPITLAWLQSRRANTLLILGNPHHAYTLSQEALTRCAHISSRYAPLIWLVHARILEELNLSPAAAWHQVRRIIRSQIRQGSALEAVTQVLTSASYHELGTRPEELMLILNSSAC